MSFADVLLVAEPVGALSSRLQLFDAHRNVLIGVCVCVCVIQPAQWTVINLPCPRW